MNHLTAIVTADHNDTFITWTGHVADWFGHTASESRHSLWKSWST